MPSFFDIYLNISSFRTKLFYLSFALGMAISTILSLRADTAPVFAFEKQSKEDRDARMAWWREARFGMFIHWGIYSVPAGRYKGNRGEGEWIMHTFHIPVADYMNYATTFDPEQFDANQWVKIAKDAGQKYIVMTSKHHDGFAMWPSKISKFNIQMSPFKRDPIREMSDACKAAGIKFGLYYSQAQDWSNPGGGNVHDSKEPLHWDSAQDGDMDHYLDTVAVPQVRELLENYPNISVLWFDIPVDMTPARCAKFYPLLEKYPNLIINDRLGAGFRGDFRTPEQYIPATGYPGRDWETCMTLNNHWGYCMDDDRWKSADDLIRKLVDVTSKGGNFLLNVGPTSKGEIPAPCVERLQTVGSWMAKNGESVYGTVAGPFPHLSWGRCTQKGQTLYLHVFDWPADGQLRVPINSSIASASFLEDSSQKITMRHEMGTMILSLPSKPLDLVDTVIACTINGEPDVSPVPSRGKGATASSVNGNNIAAHLVDGNPDSIWKAAKEDHSGWVQIDLGKPMTIACSLFDQAGNKPLVYQLEYQDGTQWKTLAADKSDGHEAQVRFSAVTAQIFRLVLLPGPESPAIREWELFPPE